MKGLKALSRFIAVKPEEKQAFRQLFLLSLFTGISISFYFVAVNTFLIQKTSVSNLPYAYIISGTVGFFLIKLYQHRQKHTSIIRSYCESIGSFSVVCILIYFAFVRYSSNPALGVYVAYLGFLFNMPFTIIFSLGFFAICARMFNLAQSKRLLALVGTGEIVASILAYLIAPGIIRITGATVNLLLISGICILFTFIPLFFINKHSREKLNDAMAVSGSIPKKINIAFFLRDNFYLLIAAATVFSVAAIYFVDYAYLVSVRFMAAETSIEIAAIVSVFFTIVKTGELTFSILSGSVLSSKGIRFCILLLPLILSGCFLMAFFSGFVLQNSIFLVAFIFLAKWSERVIRKGISTPATKVLYQVTSRSERMQIEANIEGLLNQVSTVLTGVLLIVFSRLFSSKDPMLFLSVIAGICFVAFVTWLVISLKLYDSYKKKIKEYLNQLKYNAKADSPAYSVKHHYEPVADADLTSTAYPLMQEVIGNAIKLINESSLSLRTISFYNPSIIHAADDSEMLHRKLINAYFVNENFFSRLCIIRFLGSSAINLRLFKELWKISDLELKLELISVYSKGDRADADVFYFESLCEDFARELVWVMSTEYDLAGLNNQSLTYELKLHEAKISAVLFALLKLIYEPASIQVIADIMGREGQSAENQFFALELLDNILSNRLKILLVPAFEPLAFDQKIDNLRKVFSVYTLGSARRLKDILMKDYKLINPAIKELALINYYALTADNKILDAFSHNKLKNLNLRATELMNTEKGHGAGKNKMFDELIGSYQLNKAQVACLYNWGLNWYLAKKSRPNTAGINKKESNPYLINMNLGTEDNVIIDGLAMALLIS
ncbi:MFS transporter [Mucilaginibacter polytrichastri]|uniref:ADP,ATP carrier protein n=1 Tax=Mucilaginibacter polytrichastri TaxID=1302689 RepID=A0A1Q5ZYH5_9SPHI|nr:MFS transporter [Mucilaginibacter polytrichastri]OKS86813.1 hypothetical protein RG47T_2270 [Mucilaginibacter polytrichastri]SFT22807.1 ATP/ADP translocase [Mucilaginibacter polytrichastri]